VRRDDFALDEAALFVERGDQYRSDPLDAGDADPVIGREVAEAVCD
jgi:hypothetical protein